MLTQSERVSDEYKAYLIPEIIRFYQKKGEMLVIEPYLNEVDIRNMTLENQCYMEEMLIETHQFDRAFQLDTTMDMTDLEAGQEWNCAVMRSRNIHLRRMIICSEWHRTVFYMKNIMM